MEPLLPLGVPGSFEEDTLLLVISLGNYLKKKKRLKKIPYGGRTRKVKGRKTRTALLKNRSDRGGFAPFEKFKNTTVIKSEDKKEIIYKYIMDP